jgi:hypothetical protein
MVNNPLVRFVGAVLIILGIVAFAYHGIPYRGGVQVAVVDSLRTTAQSRKIIAMSPLLIFLVLGSGAVLIAAGSSKSS